MRQEEVEAEEVKGGGVEVREEVGAVTEQGGVGAVTEQGGVEVERGAEVEAMREIGEEGEEEKVEVEEAGEI